MKILMINSVCGIRSTGRICTDLAEALTKQGNQVKIVYGREEVPERYGQYAVRVGSDFDATVHAIRSRLLDDTGFGSLEATKRLITWIKNYDPDIIHLHNIHGYYINIEALFAYLKEAHKRVIWTLHDCWAFTGHCSHFSYIKCEKWKTGCSHCPQKKRYPSSLIRDNSANNWQNKKRLFSSLENVTLVTPSVWLSDLVKQSFLKNYPVTVIHNGIDTSVFKPTPSLFRAKYNLQNRTILLGVASSWNDRKGLSDFIRLSETVGKDYQVVLVGLSDKQMKLIPDSIIGIKRTNSTKELAEIYSAADIFLNLTYEDNYPTVNLEAQACGTPVITYKTGGSIESVPEKNRVEQGDLEAVVAKTKEQLAVGDHILSRNEFVNEYMKLYTGDIE